MHSTAKAELCVVEQRQSLAMHGEAKYSMVMAKHSTAVQWHSFARLCTAKAKKRR